MLLGLLHACATDPGDSVPADVVALDPATVALDGACPMATRLGGFAVESNASYSAVDGSVLDGVIPVTVLTEVAAEGDCALYRRENPFCEDSCDPDETCALDGTCVRYPTGQELGTVTIAGLDAAVAMEPTAPGATYFSGDALPSPAYAPGALVELTSAGGALAPLRLHGVGFAPLALADDVWVLTAGSPLAVTWTPPTDAVHRATVQLTVNVDQHGATPLFLVCETADDGAAEVPPALVDAFLAAGISGWPNGRLERHTVDRAEVDGGCVDFEVRWVALPAEVSVDGHTPCQDPTDCPPGRTCDTETEQCV